MSQGFAAAMRGTGRSDNAMVVGRGTNSEAMSTINLDHRNAILTHPSIVRRLDGRLLASWEWATVVPLPRKSDGRRTNVTFRAVTEMAREVRTGIHIVAGRYFTPGLDEIIVGRRIRDRVQGIELGRLLRYR